MKITEPEGEMIGLEINDPVHGGIQVAKLHPDLAMLLLEQARDFEQFRALFILFSNRITAHNLHQRKYDKETRVRNAINGA